MRTLRSTPWSVATALAATTLMAATVAGQIPLPFGPAPSDEARAAVREDLEPARRPQLGFRVHQYLDLLVSGDADTRRRGGERLHALFVCGTEQGERPPAAGTDPSEHYDLSRRFEREVEHAAARLQFLPMEPDAVEAVPALMWLWNHGQTGITREYAAQALAWLRCPTTDPFFAQLLRRGSSNAPALKWAFHEVVPRRLTVKVAELEAFAAHHDADVRSWATHLLRLQGERPPSYVPGKSFGPWLDDLLDAIPELLAEPMPPAATWVTLAIPATGWQEQHEASGWLLERGGEGRAWRLLLPSGIVTEFEQPGIACREGEVTDHVDRLIELRARWLATADIDQRERIESELGMFRSFRSSGESWPGMAAELVLAAHCRRAGDPRRAHALLEPLLSEHDDARDFTDRHLTELARSLDAAMLDAFAIQRDYARAIELARRLMRPRLAHWDERERARELLEQLPRRMADFDALQLPSPTEWQKRQDEMPRTDRITFLVERLRLLACQQYGNPGWIDYAETQWRAGAAREPADERINPFTELLQMDLSTGELVALLPALASRDYVLAFDLHRFALMAPNQLHRVAWVAATIANEVCQEPVVDPGEWLAAEPERREAARAGLLAHCRRHADVRRSDRLAGRIASATERQDVLMAFWQLYALDEVRACQSIVATTQQQPQTLGQVVRLLCLLDRAEYVGDARLWLANEGDECRFFAAALLLRHGIEVERALQEIERGLQTPELALALPGVTDALLACKLPAARELLTALLAGEHPSGYRPSLTFVSQLWRAGWPAAHATLLAAASGERQLAIDPQLEPFAGDAEQRDTYMLQFLSSWWPDRFRTFDPSESSREEWRQRLHELLRADWQRIERNETPTCRPPTDALPWGGLRTFSTGWVRRF